MGIQDRDYYRENLRKKLNDKNPPDYIKNIQKKQTNPTSKKRKDFLMAILNLVIFWYVADKIYHRMQERRQEIRFHPETLFPQQAPQESRQDNTDQSELIPGGLVLKADRQGHYRGTVLINNVAMPYMIDTGATETAIPIDMANQAGLPIGNIVRSSTANGSAYLLSTQIESLKIGNAELRNTAANVGYRLDEVLIGMNILKRFSISVQNGTMTLIATNNPDDTAIIASRLESSPAQEEPSEKKQYPQKSAASINKSVVCNSGGTECKTSYSHSNFRR